MILFDHDLVSVLRRMPKPIFDQLKTHGAKLFVAGGFVRSCVAREEPNDIDLFAGTKEYAEACAKETAKAFGKHVISTDNAYTVPVRPAGVQYIHRWVFSEPAAALQSFDFTVAQAAVWWDGEKWQSLCSDRFYADLAARRLVYLSPDRNEDAGGSLVRVLKFYAAGYRIPLESLGAVIARLIGGIKPESHELFMKDEGWRAKILTGFLREVDPNSNPDKYIVPTAVVEEGGAA